MLLDKCCYCIELRVGCIAVAIIGLLELLLDVGHLMFPSIDVSNHIISWVNIIQVLLTSLFLLHGTIRYNKTTILIHLIIQVLHIVTATSKSVIALKRIHDATNTSIISESSFLQQLVCGLWNIGFALINTYGWMVAFSFKKHLNDSFWKHNLGNLNLATLNHYQIMRIST